MERVLDGEGMGLGWEGGDNMEMVDGLGGGGEEGVEEGGGVGGEGADEADVEGEAEGEGEEGGGDDGGDVGVVGVERFPEGGWEGEVGVVGGLRVVPGLTS